MALTQISDTRGHETRPYQCLAVNVVSFSLQYTKKTRFVKEPRECEGQICRVSLIETETTHESD